MSAIDVAATREQLAGAVRDAVGSSATVYAASIDGVSGFPAVVLGMPAWRPGPTACLSSWDFPVAVIVSRPGISEAASVTELDALWPTVLEALLDEVDVTKAEFGLFGIQGAQYPAQIITCTFVQ